MNRLALATTILAGAFAAVCACAQNLSDTGREKRWAEEVVPGLVVGDAVQLQTGDAIRFLALHVPVERPKAAVLLTHGPGLHPDHGLTGELRVSLADRGYETLSLQMPVLAAGVEDGSAYLALYPEASRRIAAGVQFLMDKGAIRIALVSHAMGAGMAHHYLRTTPGAPVFAWAALSYYGVFEASGDAAFPILDLYGVADYRGIRGPAAERARLLGARPESRQLAVPEGGRFLAGGEKIVLREVAAFLDAAAR
ncbi:MAG: DUF3530 domain-containing protein [Betaproteobacteria bacterium]